MGVPAPVAGGIPFRFAGAIDLGADGSALYEMGARIYTPSTGTFTQMERYAGSAGAAASMNRFLCAESSPATLVDPTGHRAEGCGNGRGLGGASSTSSSSMQQGNATLRAPGRTSTFCPA